MKGETSLPMAEPAQATAHGQKLWRTGTLVYTTAGLVVLFCWLLWGDFAWQMKERSVTSVVQLMFLKFQASDSLAGWLIGSVPQALGLIFGPIIAYKSDRHRGPWGRRIPFLLVSTPLVVLSMLGLAFSPEIGGFFHSLFGLSVGSNTAVLFSLGLFWTAFEVATIIANSVFNGLINDVVPTQVIGRFFGFFRALSLLAGVAFNHWLLKMAEDHYVWIFLGVATLYGVGFGLVGFRVKEGEYPPPPPAGPSRGVAGFFVAAIGYLRECFGIPYYWWFYLFISISWMAFMPINMFSIFFAKSLQMDLGFFGNCLAATFAISFVLAYPLGALADRFHPLPLGLCMQALYAAVVLAGGYFARDPASYSVVLVAHGVVSGAWMTSTASISQRLLPRSQFAQFGSAAGIVGSIFGIATGPIVGFFLDQTHHVYRFTYFISGGLDLLALTCGWVLYRKFLALGGPRGYVAPE